MGAIREAYAEIFSTMFYMERIGLLLAERYVGSAVDEAERAFAVNQKKEEAQHVALCRRLAREHGDLAPPSFWLRVMERTLLGTPTRAVQLLGLLGGDIMGDFLLQRLMRTRIAPEIHRDLDGVLEDEKGHIAHFLLHLPDALRELGFLDRMRCRWVQVVLLVADVMETRRLRRAFLTIGLDPDFESVLCYLYYRDRMGPLESTGALVMVPPWVVRMTAGKDFARAEETLAELEV